MNRRLKKAARLTCALLVALLLPLSALAEGLEPSVVEAATALAQRLDALADCPVYLKLLGGSEEMQQLIADWGAGDHDEPEQVLTRFFPTDEAAQLLLLLSLDETNGLSELPLEAVDALVRRAPFAVASALNARAGATTLAAAAMTTLSEARVTEQPAGGGMIALLYPEGAPVLVAFWSENGAITLTASFISVDEDDLKLLF